MLPEFVRHLIIGALAVACVALWAWILRTILKSNIPDARTKGLWFLIIFLTGPIGAAAYLISTKKRAAV